MDKPQTYILTDGKHNIHVEVSASQGGIRLLAHAAGEQVGDVRLIWSGSTLWIDAYTVDEIRGNEEVPELDMRVLFSLD